MPTKPEQEQEPRKSASAEEESRGREAGSDQPEDRSRTFRRELGERDIEASEWEDQMSDKPTRTIPE